MPQLFTLSPLRHKKNACCDTLFDSFNEIDHEMTESYHLFLKESHIGLTSVSL